MQYREIGSTGLRASLLGIGTMRFKGQDNAVEIIQKSLDLGLNYLDCGAAYSFKGDLENAEAWAGVAIQGRKRDEMIISAKAQPRASGEQVDRHLGINTRDQMWQCIENSLRRLGVEYLDFYQFWDLSLEEHYEAACVGKDAPMKAMLEAVDQGLVRHLGITTHGTPEAIIGFLKKTPEFRFITVYYNLIKRQVEEVIEFAHEHGVGVAVMGPLYGGILAGDSPAFSSKSEVLKGMPVHQAALYFLYDNPGVTTCLGGLNEIAHLEENVRGLKTFASLGEGERDRFRLALRDFNETEALCSGCMYCDNTCPQELPIHLLMTAYQVKKILNLPTVDARLAQMKEKGTPDPNACTACGLCTEKCPQSLPVAERMKGLAELLESL